MNADATFPRLEIKFGLKYSDCVGKVNKQLRPRCIRQQFLPWCAIVQNLSLRILELGFCIIFDDFWKNPEQTYSSTCLF